MKLLHKFHSLKQMLFEFIGINKVRKKSGKLQQLTHLVRDSSL